MTAIAQRRVQRLSAQIKGDLDSVATTITMAQATNYSRAHLIRTFKRLTGESPTALQRRLRLERAAFALSRREASIADASIQAGYVALEAFTRAFKRAFKVSPGAYRDSGTHSYWLPAPGGIHFEGQASVERTWTAMDVLTEMFKGDFRVTRALLRAAGGLSDAQLDSPGALYQPLGFDPPDRTLRQLFNRHVYTYEIWLAAMEQRAFVDDKHSSLNALEERLNRAERDFLALYARVRDQDAFNERFVDAVCEPPETFTYAYVFAHLLNFGSSRRVEIAGRLRGLGVRDLGHGDLLEPA